MTNCFECELVRWRGEIYKNNATKPDGLVKMARLLRNHGVAAAYGAGERTGMALLRGGRKGVLSLLCTQVRHREP
jgi:hypothetical protein